MFKDALSEDYLYALKVNEIEDQELKQKTEELAFQKAYADIANLYLTEKAMPITLITGMPEPNLDLNDLLMTIDTVQHKNIAETMFASMNEKQKEFFTMIQEASNEENPHKTCFYLEGAAGTGKTFCYLAIYHDLMSRGKLITLQPIYPIVSSLGIFYIFSRKCLLFSTSARQVQVLAGFVNSLWGRLDISPWELRIVRFYHTSQLCTSLMALQHLLRWLDSSVL
ncbi:PIF1-like helicase domain-containing protein [Ditylenchus destructor]|nr:PIF1-like helicase domain-containing protein [Ditylenchus destructor]